MNLNTVPTWYLKDFYIQYIDGVPLKLKKPFDLSFMRKYGKVFKVFDEQDSGNLCFGTEKDGKRYFVKFAGAPTARYDGNISDAIQRLKPITPIYRDLEHPHLIRFISAEEIGGGYAAVFEWTDAVGIGRMYPQNHKRFTALPLETKMKMFADILAFHYHVTQRGYVAIDFYDETIMYDFDTGKTVICDVDFYQKSPYYGDMGIWGSSKFVSPEECVVGERMDEITTVYTMGATAFALFSEFNRSRETWKLGDKSYEVVKKATSDNRAERQQTIRQFIEDWEAAK
jgi:serine/threonine-protein kinase